VSAAACASPNDRDNAIASDDAMRPEQEEADAAHCFPGVMFSEPAADEHGSRDDHCQAAEDKQDLDHERRDHSSERHEVGHTPTVPFQLAGCG